MVQMNTTESLNNETINQLLEEIEKNLKKQEDFVNYIASEAEKLYKNRQREIAECKCSIHICSTIFPNELKCYDKIRHADIFCYKDKQEKIDPNRTGIILPPGTNPENLTSSLKSSICTFKNLDEVIVSNLNLYEDIWTYIGINTGYFAQWPLIPGKRDDKNGNTGGEKFMNNCFSYDCRSRPWYVGAVSGPKDIIIMIDKSGSMQKKWKITIDSAIELINSLTFADYISVMLFSNSSLNVLMNDKNLIKFDLSIKEKLRLELENEPPGNDNTNFEIGFELAFDIFENSKNGTINENRAKMIVVISDGNSNEEDNSVILNYIEKRQKSMLEIFNKEVIIHNLLIYTNNLDTSLMRQISCQNTGISLLLENDESLLSELITGFLSFNALTSNRTSPVWIEPYEDFGKLGNITTVSKPIFSEDHWLIGVIGKDMKLEDLADSEEIYSFETILASLLNKSLEVKNSQVIKPCELQVLRHAGNGICPTVLDVPEETCFKFEKYWYKIEYRNLNWNEARNVCISNKGDLASVVNKDEFKFISSISHPDGTWLGATYVAEEGQYQWIDDEMPVKTEFFYAWINGIKLNSSTEPTCVVIDPRGITNNLYTEICQNSKMSFLCKFKSEPDDICFENNTIEYNFKFSEFIGNPPLEQCEDEESSYYRASFSSDDVNQITNEMALCPMGDLVDWYDMACCLGDEILWWEIFLWSILALFLVLILIYLFLVILDYIQVITLDPCLICYKMRRLCCGPPALS